jgi:iron complex transport system substrate-binding protein
MNGNALSRLFRPELIKFISIILILLLYSGTGSAAESPQRIISLSPAITETIFALGLEKKIAGVTNFCDYPEAAKKKKKVGGMSNPSLEAVISLTPDIVLFSIDGNPKEFEERLRSMKINTFVQRAKRINELSGSIRQLGAVTDSEETAERLALEIERKISVITEKQNAYLKLHYTQKPRILFIVWPEPLIVAGPGSIADDALTMLGTVNIAGDTRSTYPKYSIEEIIRRAPDIIFIGKGKNSMNIVSEGLLNRLKSVPAVKNGKVFYVSDYLYRLGPRTLSGVEELAEHIQQD